MMTNGDYKGHIFISHPHMNNGFFFLLTIKYLILCLSGVQENAVCCLNTCYLFEKVYLLVKCRHITSPFIHTLLVLSFTVFGMSVIIIMLPFWRGYRNSFDVLQTL